MNTLVRLASTVAMGIATAVYSSVEVSPQGMEQPMLKYTRTFQASLAMAALSVLVVPFIKVGTQGHYKRDDATQTITTEKGPQPAETTDAREQ